MQFKPGDRIAVENAWKLKTAVVRRKSRTGQVINVLGSAQQPRYEIAWDNGGVSVYYGPSSALRHVHGSV